MQSPTAAAAAATATAAAAAAAAIAIVIVALSTWPKDGKKIKPDRPLTVAQTKMRHVWMCSEATQEI